MMRAVSIEDSVIFGVDIPLLARIGVVDIVTATVSVIAAVTVVEILAFAPDKLPIITAMIIATVVLPLAIVSAPVAWSVITASVIAGIPTMVVMVAIAIVIVTVAWGLVGFVVVSFIVDEGLVDTCPLTDDLEHLFHHLGLLTQEILLAIVVAWFSETTDENCDGLRDSSVRGPMVDFQETSDVVS